MIATDGAPTIADPVNRPGPAEPCAACGHTDPGTICPQCDCGDPTSVVGPHVTKGA